MGQNSWNQQSTGPRKKGSKKIFSPCNGGFDQEKKRELVEKDG